MGADQATSGAGNPDGAGRVSQPQLISTGDLAGETRQLILEAAEEVLVAVAWINDLRHPLVRGLVEELVAAAARAVSVTVAMRTDASNDEAADVLTRAGCRVERLPTLHDKVVVTEQAALVGSANWTPTDLGRNTNTATLVPSPEMARSEIDAWRERLDGRMLAPTARGPAAGASQRARWETLAEASEDERRLVSQVIREILMPGGTLLLAPEIVEALQDLRDEHASNEIGSLITAAQQRLPFVAAAVQPTLVDLLAQGRLQSSFRLADRSGSFGLAAICALDFLRLYQRTVELVGPAHAIAPEMELRVQVSSAAEKEAFTAVAERLPVDPTTLSIAYVDPADRSPVDADVLIAVNQLGDPASDDTRRRAPQRIAELLSTLSDDGVLLLAEEGTPQSAQFVHGLQRSAVASGVRTLGPCASIRGRPALPACNSCTVARPIRVSSRSDATVQTVPIAYTLLQRPGPESDPTPHGPQRLQLFESVADGTGNRTIVGCDQEHGTDALILHVPRELSFPEHAWGSIVTLTEPTQERSGRLVRVRIAAHTKIDIDEARPPGREPFELIRDRALRPGLLAYFARRLFGFPSLNPGQAEIILRALRGQDVLGVLPTGGGKSATFQLPALLLPGLTLVVAPLKALLEDQVAGLRARGFTAVDRIDSSLTAAERRTVVRRLLGGELKILYVTPERLQRRGFRAILDRVRDRFGIRFMVIDEAHCVSEWGHDFRPAYLGLQAVREQLGNPPMLALTATASTRVRPDIVAQLGLKEADGDSPVVVGRGVDRPEISFAVTPSGPGPPAMLEALSTTIAKVPERVEEPGCGIVYTLYASAGHDLGVPKTAEYLRRGVDPNTVEYSGEMSDEDRSDVLAQYRLAHDGVLVATKAFGMGIDKPNVRWVGHLGAPASIEAYYQEAGRAGRDHHPAHAFMVYAPRRPECAPEQLSAIDGYVGQCRGSYNCPVDGEGKCGVGRALWFVESGYANREQLNALAELLDAWSGPNGVAKPYSGLAKDTMRPPFATAQVIRKWGSAQGDERRRIEGRHRTTVSTVLDGLRRAGFVSEYSEGVPLKRKIEAGISLAQARQRTNDPELLGLLNAVNATMDSSEFEAPHPAGELNLVHRAIDLGLSIEETSELYEMLNERALLRSKVPYTAYGVVVRLAGQALDPDRLERELTSLEAKRESSLESLADLERYATDSGSAQDGASAGCRRAYFDAVFNDARGAIAHCGWCDLCGYTSETGKAEYQEIASDEKQRIEAINDLLDGRDRLLSEFIHEAALDDGERALDRLFGGRQSLPILRSRATAELARTPGDPIVEITLAEIEILGGSLAAGVERLRRILTAADIPGTAAILAARRLALHDPERAFEAFVRSAHLQRDVRLAAQLAVALAANELVSTLAGATAALRATERITTEGTETVEVGR